jgi:hypothetical protein
MTDSLRHCGRNRPFDRCRQVSRRLDNTAAGQHAAVGHVAAVMASARRAVAGAALGADYVAEYVALDRLSGDGEGRLQNEHQRHDESRSARYANSAYAVPHGLPL